MNNYTFLPPDIFSKIGVTFTNPINRILANQYPYDVKTKTVYWTKNTKLKNIFETTLDATVIIFRGEDGEFIDTLFIPEAESDNPYCRLISKEPDIDKRIPSTFLKNY